MRQVMVRYTVKPDRAAENEELIRAVYDELAATAPTGLRYATYRLDDGVSFVHVASAEDDDNALAESAAFARFQAGVRDRCDVQPVVTELHEVGAYRP
jgi:hypothetical protein